ncbi:MAG: bifunctional 3-hydroxydecanoyl-ACP dehydratase/trans-2-decenoyl-ACP isomerase [Candidatus Binatia bacterium]
MTYDEFRERRSFEHAELLAFAHGTLIDDEPEGFACRLPLPPMLMVDRIGHIGSEGRRGTIVAERDVRVDDWFFQCHFKGDPVQPGCLGVDAIWQLVGFYCGWAGAIGSGRALGCGEVTFEGQIRPMDATVRYEVEIRRFASLVDSGAAIAVGDGRVLVDGEQIYSIKGARVGVFRDIAYVDYPRQGRHSRGGVMERG